MQCDVMYCKLKKNKQKINKKGQAEAITSPSKFYELLRSDSLNLHTICVVNEGIIDVVYIKQPESDPVQVNINIFIARFTTCWTRLKLYKGIQRLKPWQMMYFDKDSISYVWKPKLPKLPLGNYLASSFNVPIYLLGDLNCGLENSDDPGAKALVIFCRSYNLSILINTPTRVTETSKSILDVILASDTRQVQTATVMESSISDHDLVYVTLRLKKVRPKPVYITTRSFKHYSPIDFSNDVSLAP